MKQETIEEVAHNFATKEIEECTSYHDLNYGFTEGAKWQAERMYSEEEVYDILVEHTIELFKKESKILNEWFEQYKKK